MLLTFAEIRRRPGRFLLLAGAVALLVLLLLFFRAVGGALTTGLTGAIENVDAEVLVYSDRARRNPQASVVDGQAVQQVAAVDGVATAAGVAQTVTVVDGTDAAVVGVDPEGPGLPTQVTAGRLPTAPGEAALSVSGLAPSDLAPGDVAEVAAGDGVTVALTVTGLVADASISVLPTFYVPLPTFGEVFAAQTGAPAEAAPLNYVAVRTADDVDPTVLAKRITDAVGASAGLEAVDRATAVASLPGVDQIDRSFAILDVLLFVVVAVVTAVFFLILTVQKRDALLLLRAVGATRGEVIRPTLVQILLVVGVGVIVGTGGAVGLLTAARDVFGAGVRTADAVSAALVVVALGMLSGALSIRRIARIEPVEVVTGTEL